MRTLPWATLLLLSLASVPLVSAQTEAGSSDLLGGFEETGSSGLLGGFEEASEGDLLGGFDTGESLDETAPAEPLLPAALSGIIGFDLSYAYARETPTEPTQPDWSGVRKAKSFLQLRWDEKYGGVRVFVEGQAGYDAAPEPLDAARLPAAPVDWRGAYEETRKDEVTEAEFREVSVAFSPADFLDVKLGRQVVVWGKADALTVVDVLNPRDNREVGLVDLADTRLPVTATRLDVYGAGLQLQVVANHELRFSKEAGFGNEYFLYPDPDNLTAAANAATLSPEVLPAEGGANTEWGVALKGSGIGWDLALYYADYFDDTPHLSGTLTVLNGVPVPAIEGRVHSRLKLNGLGGTYATGSWLFKGEVAQVRGVQFFGSDQSFSRTDLAAGVEFAGLTETRLVGEASVQHLNEFEEIPYRTEGLPNANLLEDILRVVLSWQQDLLQQTLHANVTLLSVGRTGEHGGSQRASLEYDWTDAVSVTGGVIDYRDGQNAYAQQLSDNDRVYLNLRYTF